MGLPNIGPLELIIILAIALLIVGPGRLPEMGNAIGRTIREFRKASSDMTDAVKIESEANTLKDESKPNTSAATEAAAAPAADGVVGVAESAAADAKPVAGASDDSAVSVAAASAQDPTTDADAEVAPVLKKTEPAEQA